MEIPYAEKVTFGRGIARAWKYWATSDGTASRSEFWSWIGFVAIVNISLNLLKFLDSEASGGNLLLITVITLGWVVAIAIPTVAIFIRRGRDVESLGLAGFGIVLFGTSQIISFFIFMQLLLNQSLSDSMLATFQDWLGISNIIYFAGIVFAIMLGIFDGVSAPPTTKISNPYNSGIVNKMQSVRKVEANPNPAPTSKIHDAQQQNNLNLPTLLPLMKIVYEGENPNNSWEKLLEAYLIESYLGKVGYSDVVATFNRLSIIAQKLNDAQPSRNLPYQTF